MEVQISLTVETPSTPVRMDGRIPVYPMGQDLSVVTTFANPGSQALSLDDPQVSTALHLMLKQQGPEDALFMLHPRQIDATGEVTSPAPSTLNLVPGRNVTIPFNLHEIIVDRCFLPGVYDIYIEFHDIKSPLFEFGVEYRPESVPLLLKIATDEQANTWLRRESMNWLNKLPNPPQIILPQPEETEAAMQKRMETNKEKARQFMDDWRYGRDADETVAFFRQFRLGQTE